MSRTFKICFNDGSDNKEVFVVKPNSENFGSLVEEIYARKPELRNKPLKCHYEDSDGDKIVIAMPSDFALFLEQNINKIFAEESSEETVWKSLNPSLLNTIPAAQTSNPVPANTEAKQSIFIDEIRKIRHENILCDVCDKEVYGFRYKCLDCEEFDMCMDCAPKQIHMEHLVLRITNPIEGEKHFHLHVTDPEEN
ncbi:hypothetical protein HA402_015990 [Bradysia odoriphaga]|nr:hypothetical protein HA402_015990 [Bradysia odoriphaga]